MTIHREIPPLLAGIVLITLVPFVGRGEPAQGPANRSAQSPDSARTIQSSSPPSYDERFTIEPTIGFKMSVDDSYNQTLEAFGMDPVLFDDSDLLLSLSASWLITENFGVLLSLSSLEARHYQSTEQEFDWSAYTLGVFGRLQLPIHHWLIAHVQVGAGPGLGITIYNATGENHYKEYHFGPQLGGSIGVRFMSRYGIGGMLQAGYTWARIIENELQESHNSGGFWISSGICFAG